MTAVKVYVTNLRLPLGIEVVNILVHRIAHWNSIGTTYVDMASLVVSAVAVFLASWLHMRRTRHLGRAVLAGMFIWAAAVALVAILLVAELLLFTPLRENEGLLAIGGYVLASVLFLPAVMLISGIAAFIAKHAAP